MNTQDKTIQILSLITLTTILGALPSISFAGVEWVQQTDMLTPRVTLSCSVVDGKIYAIGGKPVGYTQNRLSTVEEYDPITSQWTSKANMPSRRSNLSTSVVGGIIYAIGGYGGPKQKTIEAYDPVTDTWTRKTSMPIAEADHSSAAIDSKVYVIGGDTVQIYDPLSDTWT